jgi:UDP-N-acetylmuramate: L-alanyl-gamma-D-glutamyl-meso-diaminopimelate ligase
MTITQSFCDNPQPLVLQQFPGQFHMHIHILGICGTFMGSLAVLARQLGYEVSGCDQNVYPPMSTQLESQGIILHEGYDPDYIDSCRPDLIVIGNTCSRGNRAVEHVLDKGLPFTSGPGWLAEHVLQGRWVLGVAGTHGKTTTTSMLAWILEYAGMQPGYLIGGVPKNFNVSARLGESDFFVIEADEYDSAFFDKRSKFIHYLPRTLIMGNLEFDHADIFRSLEDIQNQFHHLVKTIPANGLIVAPDDVPAIEEVFSKGLWSSVQRISVKENSGSDWIVQKLAEDGSQLLLRHGDETAEIQWSLLGEHNARNALAAAAAALHVGVPLAVSCEALAQFKGVKRRLELIGEVGGVRVYDDFAHHPTAILTTLQGIRAAMSANGTSGRLIAVIEARSNTMKMGYHQHTLAASLAPADLVCWYRSEATRLDLDAIACEASTDLRSITSTQGIIDVLAEEARPGDHIVIMSNGGFEGLHQRMLAMLASRPAHQAG